MCMPTAYCWCACVCLAVLAQTEGRWRIWQQADGSQVEAAFVELVEFELTLRRKKDGKTFTVSLGLLSERDQEYAREEQRKRDAIAVRKVRGKRPSRESVPALLLLGFPGVRKEIGLLAENGLTAETDAELDELLLAWRQDGRTRRWLAADAAVAEPHERLELLFQQADAWEARVRSVLSPNQWRNLSALRERTLFALVARVPPLRLVSLPAVQSELQLTDDQRAAIEKWRAERAPPSGEPPAGESQQEQRDREWLRKLLTSAQARRLQQIQLQLEAAGLVQLQPGAAARLRLTAAQKEECAAIFRQVMQQALDAYVPQLPIDSSRHIGPQSPQVVSGELVRLGLRLVPDVLTDKQRREWSLLIGETVELFEAPPGQIDAAP